MSSTLQTKKYYNYNLARFDFISDFNKVISKPGAGATQAGSPLKPR
jgi:hypothetical protein